MNIDVAPHAGAWIETSRTADSIDVSQSHPTRVRGLKRREIPMVIPEMLVAPHAGAWIETSQAIYHIKISGSHPTRVRGLKLISSQRL